MVDWPSSRTNCSKIATSHCSHRSGGLGKVMDCNPRGRLAFNPLPNQRTIRYYAELVRELLQEGPETTLWKLTVQNWKDVPRDCKEGCAKICVAPVTGKQKNAS